jgi:hypothetical protein
MTANLRSSTFTDDEDKDQEYLMRQAIKGFALITGASSGIGAIASPLMSMEYERVVPDYSKYKGRLLLGPLSAPGGFAPEGRGAASDLRIDERYSPR